LKNIKVQTFFAPVITIFNTSRNEILNERFQAFKRYIFGFFGFEQEVELYAGGVKPV
jgi:hypothetical protein